MKANVSRIKELCKERGISVSFVCEKVGQGAYYLNDVKRRGGNIPEDRMNIIADILDASIEYLTDETDDPTPKQKRPTSWRDMDMSIEKRNFFEELDKLSDEQILSLSRIIFPIIDEIKANRKERQ